MKPIRICVLYGQGGFLTSLGMVALAKQIRGMFGGAVLCTEHKWHAQQEVYDAMKEAAGRPVVMVGYSLGANSTAAIAAKLLRTVDLIVAYDPSWLSPQTRQIGRNVKRCVLYHGTGFSYLGHALFTGPTVEVIDTANFHLAIDFDQQLHNMTIKAIARLLP